ncbi:uncharacterized protein LOC130994888 [Salvia miltiorrhiza]|uniref:uncharacterized protein LOC130994888 n=1 Tax=Salvia miltiorrhiza TaxID=226208 RepID=UPI0025AD9897|nr:uncharacterized protein LOC130994888 [Salvia miltiorrhiza]
MKEETPKSKEANTYKSTSETTESASEDIPDLSDEGVSHNDFKDGAWSQKDALILETLSEDAIIRLGNELLTNLTAGISQRHVGSILLLAFHLHAPGIGNTERIVSVDKLARERDSELMSLENTVTYKPGKPCTVSEKGTKFEKARAYAFIAASMLKMFTRSSENYCRSWTHILNGHRKFYLIETPITAPKPLGKVLQQIRHHFSVSDIMKATLYRILYNMNEGGNITSVQKYLYDIHLSHTGMHIVPIAYNICLAMNVSPGDLIRAIYSPSFHPQIVALVAAFNLMMNHDEEHTRQMWKYGRIFESKFFSTLQTRSCRKLCFTLACILKRERARSHARILDIKQFEAISQEDREKLEEGAKLIVRALNIIAFGEPKTLVDYIFSA